MPLTFKKPDARRVRGSLLLAFVLLMTGVSASQAAYPKDRLPLRVTIGGIGLNSAQRQGVPDKLATLLRPLNLTVGSQAVTVSPEQVGAHIDTAKTLAQIPDVPLARRLIPFWGWYQLSRPHMVEPVFTYDPTLVSAVAAAIAKQEYVAPSNASLKLAGGKLTVDPEQAGLRVDQDKLGALIEDYFAKRQPDSVALPLPTQPIPPSVVAADFAGSVSKFAAVTGSSLSVIIDSTSFALSSADLARLTFITGSGANASISMSAAALDQQIASWSKQVSQAPGVTQITYLDDVVASQQVGVTGKKIDTKTVSDAILGWFNNPQGTSIQLKTTPIPPSVAKTYTYSHSSQQLQAQLQGWLASHSGNYQIAVRELDGKGRKVTLNGSDAAVTASTYKLFVAYAAFKQGENNALPPSTVAPSPAPQGTTVGQCIQPMIVNSDNSCGVSLGWLIGWDKIDDLAHSAGFGSVQLNNYDASGAISGDKTIKVDDVTLFLAELAQGNLLNAQDTATLLGYMKGQVYRQGIPAGSEGAAVADKVGFLEDGTLNDVGIVYGKNSTYVLSVLSTGSSWANISAVATAVYDFMNS